MFDELKCVFREHVFQICLHRLGVFTANSMHLIKRRMKCSCMYTLFEMERKKTRHVSLISCRHFDGKKFRKKSLMFLIDNSLSHDMNEGIQLFFFGNCDPIMNCDTQTIFAIFTDFNTTFYMRMKESQFI